MSLESPTSNERFGIGELSRRSGIRVSTIRYYERRGLLDMPARSRNGYRMYAAEHVERLALIRQAKGLGFVLGEIQDLLNVRSNDSDVCGIRREKAIQRLKKIEEEIRERKQFVRRINKALSDCDQNQCPFSS